MFFFGFSDLLADKFCLVIDGNLKRNKKIKDIDEKYLICSKENSKVIEAQKVKFYDRNNTEKDSLLYKKILIINSKKSGNGVINVVDIPIYSSPSPHEKKPFKKISNFDNFYFLLKEHNKRFLLSKYPKYNANSYKDKDSENNILGWIDKKFTKEWNSRIAIELNEEEGGIKAYLSVDFQNKDEILLSKNNDNLKYPLLKSEKKYIEINHVSNKNILKR